jgi:hypothetical protein
LTDERQNNRDDEWWLVNKVPSAFPADPAVLTIWEDAENQSGRYREVYRPDWDNKFEHT